MTDISQRVIDFWERHAKFTWVQDLKQKGFKRALLDDLKGPETRTYVLTLLIVGLVCFVWGARADCQKYGGVFLFTSKWGVSWSCYNRSALETPEWATPWNFTNITLEGDLQNTLKERDRNETQQIPAVG